MIKPIHAECFSKLLYYCDIMAYVFPSILMAVKAGHCRFWMFAQVFNNLGPLDRYVRPAVVDWLGHIFLQKLINPSFNQGSNLIAAWYWQGFHFLTQLPPHSTIPTRPVSKS